MMSRLISYLKRFIHFALRKRGYEIQRAHAGRPIGLQDVARLFFNKPLRPDGEIFFVQFGAYDGESFDPIFAQVKGSRARGLLVEPQKRAYQQLVRNYGDDGRLTFVNAAISRESGRRTLYTVDEEMVRRWPNFGACARFDRDSLAELMKGRFKAMGVSDDPQTHIQAEDVEVVTTTELLERHGIREMDLLLIDTEGYDFEILKMMDFKRWRPTLVVFENRILTLEEQEAAGRLLASHGYDWFTVGWNTCAVLTS